MLILLLVLFILLFILGAYIEENTYSYGGEVLGIISIVACIAVIISGIAIIVDYPRNIEEKLNMYQEENQSIESKVKETIKMQE